MPHIYTIQPLDSHRVSTIASSGNVCDVGAIYSVIGRGVVLVVAGDDDVTGGNVRDIRESQDCFPFRLK